MLSLPDILTFASELPAIVIPIAYVGVAVIAGSTVWWAATNVSVLRSMRENQVTKYYLSQELKKLSDDLVTKKELPYLLDQHIRARRLQRQREHRREREEPEIADD